MEIKPNGLTKKQAKILLHEHGKNVLPENPPPSDIKILLSQFKNPLVYVLLFSGIISLFLKHYPDASIIFFAVLINTVLGFIQERKADRALDALKKHITQYAEVIRDRKRKKIKVSQLVPGDVVVLNQGSKVPADCVLLDSNRFFCDESILTGESMPVSKEAGEEVFMGTLVSSGRAMAEVKVTGSDTKIGNLAIHIQDYDEQTPLKKHLKAFSRNLVLMILFLLVVVFLIGILSGLSFSEMFATSVALAVSSIPESLLVTVTVVLALSMQRILRRKGLVRRLSSAETLGSVSTICIDKTGTLTRGKMQVIDFFGDEIELAKQVVAANDLDDPIVISAFEWGRKKVKNFIQEHPRIDSIPFSPKEKFFSSLNKWSGKENMLFVNGAPEVLLGWSSLSQKDKRQVEGKIDQYSSQGKRIIGFARKLIPAQEKEIKTSLIKGGLEWVGFLVFSDPVRLGVKDAIEKAVRAGIDIVVITGDYAKTAQYVMAEIGLKVKKNEILLGEQIKKIPIEKLGDRIKKIKLFARTSPDQKHKIIETLKKKGEVVAMMGDGVNDAPALQSADIGIVVSEASDVSRESADLVLLDSNFSTIIAAVEEGRVAFDNIRKIILYLLSDAFAEIIVVLGGILLKLPLPITAVQILWLNLVSDGFPDLALTVDPRRPGLMEEKPRSSKDGLVQKWMFLLILSVSLLSGLAALGMYSFVLNLFGDHVLARSVTYLVLGMNSLIYVFTIRTLNQPFWKSNIFENKWLILAVLVGFFFLAFPFFNSLTRGFFGFKIVPYYFWIFSVMISFQIFFTIEVLKFFFRKVIKIT